MPSKLLALAIVEVDHNFIVFFHYDTTAEETIKLFKVKYS